MANPPLYNVRPVENLRKMLDRSVELFGEKNAFLLKLSDNNFKEVKYREFKQEVDALGTALINMGLKDSSIALISENRYEWCVSYLSVVNGTGVVVPLDKELPSVEIENLLLRSGAKAVIFSGRHKEEILSLRPALPGLRYLIDMDGLNDTDSILSYRKLVEKGMELLAAGDRSFLDAEIDREAMSILLFTSGTTDLAKGVMLSHKNLCTNLMAVCSVLHIDEKDSSLSILPLHHTYECTCGFLVMIYNGCTIAFNEGLKHISRNLKETSPTILFLVPLILESMYKKIWDQAGKKRGMKIKLKAAIFISDFLYNVFKIDLRKTLFKQIHESIGGRVRLVISGAAAINPQVSKGLRSFGIRVVQGYGLTECSPIVAVNTDKQFKDASIGPSLPGLEIKIDGPEHSGVGEIAVKGDSVMLGYYKNEAATQKVLKDGWFFTGDLGHVDDEGFMYITGRKKNVIVTKNGKNIFPEEVEAYLNKSPYIQESLVWGKYEEESGETYVNAQIVPDFDEIKQKLRMAELSLDDVYRVINAEVRSINRNMPLYKRIRDFSVRENEFAKTTTKKIKRYVEKTG